MSTLASKLFNLAEIFQGLAMVGGGAGARRGDWMLRMVQSSDLQEDGWLHLNGLREIGVVQAHECHCHHHIPVCQKPS